MVHFIYIQTEPQPGHCNLCHLHVHKTCIFLLHVWPLSKDGPILVFTTNGTKSSVDPTYARRVASTQKIWIVKHTGQQRNAETKSRKKPSQAEKKPRLGRTPRKHVYLLHINQDINQMLYICSHTGGLNTQSRICYPVFVTSPSVECLSTNILLFLCQITLSSDVYGCRWLRYPTLLRTVKEHSNCR